MTRMLSRGENVALASASMPATVVGATPNSGDALSARSRPQYPDWLTPARSRGLLR